MKAAPPDSSVVIRDVPCLVLRRSVPIISVVDPIRSDPETVAWADPILRTGAFMSSEALGLSFREGERLKFLSPCLVELEFLPSLYEEFRDRSEYLSAFIARDDGHPFVWFAVDLERPRFLTSFRVLGLWALHQQHHGLSVEEAASGVGVDLR